MNGNEIDTITEPAVSIATANLQLVLLLEEWRPLCLRHVSMASRIARLMCVFLTGEVYCVLLAWVTCIPRAYPSEHLLPKQRRVLHIHLAVTVPMLEAAWPGIWSVGLLIWKSPRVQILPPANRWNFSGWSGPNSAPPRLGNSQLVSLPPVWIFNKLLFNSVTTFVCTLMSVSSVSMCNAKHFNTWNSILIICHNFILFVFAGNDLFLNSSVHDFLSALLRIYTSPLKLEQLDFNSPIPGLTSFYDL